MLFHWLSSKYHEVSWVVDYLRPKGLQPLRVAPNWPHISLTAWVPFVWFFFEPETVSRDSYYLHITPNLVRGNDCRSFSCMYTDFQLVSFNSQLFFLVFFIFSCRLFYSVVCVAAVICFGFACQPCCIVLWELEPASIVSISSSLSLPFPRPAIPWNPPGTPRHSLGSVLTLFSHSQELVVNTAGSYCVWSPYC